MIRDLVTKADALMWGADILALYPIGDGLNNK